MGEITKGRQAEQVAAVGVVTRQQALASGLSPGQIRGRLVSGTWQTLHPGVYATFSGPVPPRLHAEAAVLSAGPGAVAGPRTTLWLAGVNDKCPPRLDVAVPSGRHVRDDAPFRVYRRVRLDDDAYPSASPPRLRVEIAVLVVCSEMHRPGGVVDVVVRAVQRGVTTATRLERRLAGLRGHRWRRLLDDLLADVRDGVRSALELQWVRAVERAHGLPASVLNRPDADGPRRAYRDVEFVEFGLVVELDGREAHPTEAAFRDRRRDNNVTVSGRRTLRYGWREVAGDPCGIALEVARTLRLLGWQGHARPCGAGCPIGQLT